MITYSNEIRAFTLGAAGPNFCGVWQPAIIRLASAVTIYQTTLRSSRMFVQTDVAMETAPRNV